MKDDSVYPYHHEKNRSKGFKDALNLLKINLMVISTGGQVMLVK